jgi:uncharacterized protein
MPDFRKMTVQRLRELARKMLGPGHSRLTKGDLVERLEAAEKKLGSTVEKTATRVRQATRRAGAAAEKPVRAAAKRAPAPPEKAGGKKKSAVRKAGAAVAAAAGAAACALVARAQRRKRARAGVEAAAGPMAEAVRSPSTRSGQAEADAEEPRGVLPDPEGYFVARVRGEDAVRDAPHPMSESVAGFRGEEGSNGHVHEENLGELPWSHGDDAFVAMPRDPRTLFVYWDHASATRTAAFEGLEQPRAQLWVFARRDGDWDRIRTVELALEARGWYVHDLEPGRVYRAEIHAVDRAGRVRAVGGASNDVQLPPHGPSPFVDDRFIRLPWTLPLGRLLGPGHEGTPFSEEARNLLTSLSDWSRYAEQAGGGGESAGGGGAAGGLGGRMASGGPPSSTSPSGGGGPR